MGLRSLNCILDLCLLAKPTQRKTQAPNIEIILKGKKEWCENAKRHYLTQSYTNAGGILRRVKRSLTLLNKGFISP